MQCMTCTVKVENGAIRLPAGLELPDGSEVQLTVPDVALAQPLPRLSEVATASFAERYAAYVGAADDLPADLAENLDHYAHGQRKQRKREP